MKRNSTLLLAAAAGALGASFFVGEPQVKQRVMTEFDVMNIEAAKRKRERRRMRKYQKGVLQKEEQKQEKSVADVLVVGHRPSNLSTVLAAHQLSGPQVILVNKQPVADVTMLEVLASLHRRPTILE